MSNDLKYDINKLYDIAISKYWYQPYIRIHIQTKRHKNYKQDCWKNRTLFPKHGKTEYMHVRVVKSHH